MVKVKNIDDNSLDSPNSYETNHGSCPSPEYQKQLEEFRQLVKTFGLAYAIENKYLVVLNVRRKGKKLFIEARRVSENEIENYVKESQKVHYRNHVIMTAVASCLGAAGVALAPHFNLVVTQKGAEALNTFWAGAKGGLDAMEKKLSDNDQGELTGFQHLTESYRSHKSDVQQSIQDSEQAMKDIEEKHQRIAQKTNEMQLRIYGG